MFTNDILLYGKHAIYSEFLCKSIDKNNKGKNVAGVFETVYDVYSTGVVIGLYLGRRAPIDRESSATKRIFADKVIREQSNLIFLYRLVMLISDSSLTADEKIKRAFKESESPEKMELFNSYARGGIEWLYEQFTSTANTKEEYLHKIQDIVVEFNTELKIING